MTTASLNQSTQTSTKMNPNNIDGWMSPVELEWLTEQAAHYKIIVEIGSYKGRSTMALAQGAPGVVYAVDNWYGPKDVDMPSDQRQSILDEFKQNLKAFIEDNKVIVETCDHKDAINLKVKPDMVFIDGDHTYEGVKSDIAIWLYKAAPGALICGHDAQAEGVKQAVLEAFGVLQVGPGTTIWFARKNV